MVPGFCSDLAVPFLGKVVVGHPMGGSPLWRVVLTKHLGLLVVWTLRILGSWAVWEQASAALLHFMFGTGLWAIQLALWWWSVLCIYSVAIFWCCVFCGAFLACVSNTMDTCQGIKKGNFMSMTSIASFTRSLFYFVGFVRSLLEMVQIFPQQKSKCLMKKLEANSSCLQLKRSPKEWVKYSLFNQRAVSLTASFGLLSAVTLFLNLFSWAEELKTNKNI